MDGIEVDPESLRRSASELQSAADTLNDAVDAFEQALAPFGDPWGTDMLGTLIGGGYVAIEQLALKTLDSIIDSFDAFAEKLDLMATNYSDAEQSSSEQVDSVGREV